VTFSRYTLRPTLRAALMGFLVHHNPFYLLSALCMVAGCFAINSGLAPRTAELPKLLLLLTILNGYEGVVIALGLYLIRRRGIERDGRTLLLIEAPFLVDLTFLVAEAGSVSFEAGAIVNAIVLLLAILKSAIVLRILCGRWPRGGVMSFIVAELTVLFMMPTALRWFDRAGQLGAVHFYFAWWAVGLLLIGYELQGRLFGPGKAPDEPRVATTIRRLYTGLPLVSLIAHLGMLHWVYLVDFSGADLAPVLLGAAVALRRLAPCLVGVRLVLPALALLFSGNDYQFFHQPLLGRVELTPVLLTVAAAYLIYVYSFFLRQTVLLIGGAAAVVLAIALGPTIAQMEDFASMTWHRSCDLAEEIRPKTAMQWGLVSIVSGFMFLLLGAAVSLRKESVPPPGD